MSIGKKGSLFIFARGFPAHDLISVSDDREKGIEIEGAKTGDPLMKVIKKDGIGTGGVRQLRLAQYQSVPFYFLRNVSSLSSENRNQVKLGACRVRENLMSKITLIQN